MKYKLLKPINPEYTTYQQILTNRNVPFDTIEHYIHTTDDDICSPLLLGEENLKQAAILLTKAIQNNYPTLIIVDSDDDGFTSSALLINYLYDIFPTWVINYMTWFLHQEKQHGLSDCYDYILKHKYSLVICPDSASNDYQYHKILKDNNIKTIILDHHEAEYISKDAIVINNQLSDYLDKDMSGVGITWQFCRYLDNLLNINNADKYLDLVALGLVGDMSSLRNIEVKHLINKGFKSENIHNPFIYNIWEKNHFKLGDHITPWGATFYIVPFVNAITRTGTQEEKELIFESMLTFKAFDIVPSTKRGHLLGETEKKVEQAMRVCTNVKNRQSKAQEDGMNLLEHRIEDESLLDNQVLLFLIEPNELNKGILGLIANKMMAKYQRPCCILTKKEDNTDILYQGSARGCDKVGVNNFKDICAETGKIVYAEGHQGAFGLCIRKQDLPDFINNTNIILKDMPSEPVYYVDYIYSNNQVNPQNILDIADMNSYWGKDIDESLIAIENLKVTQDMVQLMSPDKNPTLKITLPNYISLIKFGSNQEEYEKFLSQGYVKVNIVGKCNKNEWNGNITPQIFIEDYDIIENIKYYF